jgi:hypothetical protein
LPPIAFRYVYEQATGGSEIYITACFVQEEQPQDLGLKLSSDKVVKNEMERFPQWQRPLRTFDSTAIASF